MFPGEPMVGELRLCGGPEIPVIGDRHTGYHAEREGFEPSIALRLFQFSRLALSTTQTPLLLLHDRFRSLPRWAEGTVNRSAERVGFESTVPVNAHLLSRQASSSFHGTLHLVYLVVVTPELIRTSGILYWTTALCLAELRAHVELGVDAVDVSLSENFLDHFHPLLPLAAMAIYEGRRLWVGQQSMDGFKLALARRSQRMVVTQAIGAAVYAMDGGLLSFPAAIAGGLVFDRTINQAALATSYQSHQAKLLSLRLLQQERV